LAKIPQVQCLKTSPPESGLVSFQIESHQHKSLVEFLEARDIMVRTILDPNCTRACVHYFTTTEEMDRLVAGVAEFCQ
jgi:L-cysteine/cystine lyase